MNCEKYSIDLDGVKVYDPRINEYITSANSALVMADMIERGYMKSQLSDSFWLDICNMANYCDE